MLDGILGSRIAGLLPYLLRTLLLGAGTTLVLTLASLLLAIALGFVLALLRRSDNLLLGGIARIYLEIFRNVPILT